MAFVAPFEALEHSLCWTLLAWSILPYIVGLVIYRLYLSPIANFPGSKFTAITSWYQFYHDVIRGGQFTFVIQRWHEQYDEQGPIIRINPTEIHISDPDFYDIIYSQTRVNKEESFRYRFGNPGSMFCTVEKDLHQKRRAAMTPYFSRRQILEFTPYIQMCVDKLCHRLNNEYRGKFKVVTMDHVFAAFVTDNVTYYSFEKSYDFLSYPDFVTPFPTALEKLNNMSPVLAHFPWLMPIMESLPKRLSAVLQPSMIPIFDFRDVSVNYHEIEAQIRNTINSKNDAGKNVNNEDENIEHKTVFAEILNSDMPPEELSPSRLRDEAIIIVAAGIATTKLTMSVACFHVLDNPRVYNQLCKELMDAFPDPSMQPSLPELEKLPYLTAVIQESLRFSPGVVKRLPRIFESAIGYGSYIIPPGVPVSLSPYLQHHDERIFPSSQIFKPERWLGNSQASGTDKPLLKYLVSFSKGTRNCLGMNLAYAELYIGLATVFRRVNMELFETQRDAVDMAADYFALVPKAGTQGVRVLIK